MTTTALNLIEGALRPLNVLTGNTRLTAEEISDTLQALNWMLDSWSNENLKIYHVTRETFTLTSGLNPHTIGPGGNLNTTRPTRIIQATITISGVDYPLELIGVDDYEAIRLKTLQTAWPIYAYLENDFPLAKLYTWPINTGNVINLQQEKPLTNFASAYDTVTLPPGYADAIRFNLALRMAPEFQITAGADLERMAERALKNIKRTNSRVPTMASDPMLRARTISGGYIVYTDGIR